VTFFLGAKLSPTVQQPTAVHRQPDATSQHWSMLILESLSGGVLAVFILFTMIMMLVSIYVVLVWPLTFWDLAGLKLEKYGSWANIAIWSVFGGGTLAGYWCFSGAAFKSKPRSARKTGR
jgi:hypothetical protein